jgi:hypothetical protein
VNGAYHSAQTDKLNQLTEWMGICYNLFQHVLRQKTKLKLLDSEGNYRYYCNHDRAQTPFQRLVTTGSVDNSLRAEGQILRNQTNPIALKQQIDELFHSLLASSTCKKRG